MIGVIRLARLVRIHVIVLKHGLTRPVVGGYMPLRLVSYLNPWSFRKKQASRGTSLRLILESLGPVFVKFGQLLSTRRDLIADDIADELAKLQDQVPPFASAQAINIIEKSYKQPIAVLFKEFDTKPLASASIAQVHGAILPDNSPVIVKVLRPNIAKIIRHDISLLYLAANIVGNCWRSAKRLKPVELVAEFEQTILDEMNLNQEAASAAQLRRNFSASSLLYVPKIHWPLVTQQVMVMERINGVRISDITALTAAGTNLKKLAERGVEIFFTQVLRDNFFHADMHPGNLFVDINDRENPTYLAVDFGIMGTLSEQDQHYLAANLLAFFKRDYRRVAVLHVESGWVPANTRVDQFEAAMRTVCEPIFERPLKDISFGKLLLSLFRTAERFNMNLQPQLMLLQKTLLNIEGLGRQLYPDLDLWKTAKPFLEQWMKKQHGMLSSLKQAALDLPQMSEKLLKTPDLLYQILRHTRAQHILGQSTSHAQPKINSSNNSHFFFGAAAAFSVTTIISYTIGAPLISSWAWGSATLAVLSLLLGFFLSRNS